VASLLVILLDEGTGVNHFLDVAALTALGAGAAVSKNGHGDVARSALASLLALALVWGMVTFTVLDLRPQVLGAWRALRSGPSARYAPTPLSSLIRPGDAVLSEDPTVPVRLGRFPPVVLDAWALLRMEHRHPEWIADLAGRIEREEFDWIVLSYGLEFRGWYSDVHFGDTIAEAIRAHYRPADAAETNGYFVYVPADRAP
jgi:hypothetical protein